MKQKHQAGRRRSRNRKVSSPTRLGPSSWGRWESAISKPSLAPWTQVEAVVLPTSDVKLSFGRWLRATCVSNPCV